MGSMCPTFCEPAARSQVTSVLKTNIGCTYAVWAVSWDSRIVCHGVFEHFSFQAFSQWFQHHSDLVFTSELHWSLSFLQEFVIAWNASTATGVCRTGGKTMIPGKSTPNGIRPVSSSSSKEVRSSFTLSLRVSRTSIVHRHYDVICKTHQHLHSSEWMLILCAARLNSLKVIRATFL